MSAKLTIGLSSTNGTITRQFTVSNRTISAVNPGFNDVTQKVGFAAPEAFTPVDLAAMGSIGVENLDPTNFVNYGAASAALGFKLLAGEAAVFRASALWLQADTAEVKVRIFALDS